MTDFKADLSPSTKYGNSVFDLDTQILLNDIIPTNDTALLEFWLTFPFELHPDNKTAFTGVIEASCEEQTDPIAVIVTNVTGLTVSNACDNIPGHTSLTCTGLCGNPTGNAAAAGIEEEEPEYVPTYIGMIMMVGLFTVGGTAATIGITKLLG
eukprot:CAMPEP_0114657002 /NCGR_PEP_ID=MMETSP0191-20121206/13215_1 /TAXON_ID=126664 /ORGANISM="Sorites sp." /LENGTH=152 /DNA_ID=CAMNT_0001875395 /DNA_START=1081 /DNA_END=1542 /DNA_ORIENTATION=-